MSKAKSVITFQIFRKGKVHKQTGSDEIMCNFNGRIWDMSRKDRGVTCKRCLAKMKAKGKSGGGGGV